jgi:O-Antigen ligase
VTSEDPGVAARAPAADPTLLRREPEAKSAWLVASLLGGLILIDGLREGGFWQADALLAALASLVLLALAAALSPIDRRAWAVIGALLLLALWWLGRAWTAGPFLSFLPFGASVLAFATAFAAVRPLERRQREVAALAVGCLGATGALIGFAGLIWRWFPMAMPAQGLWRLSSTLTYSDAAGLVLGVSLLMAMSTDLCPWLARLAVCLSAGGLLATQSRGAYVAFACASVVVPWRRYLAFVGPLLSGMGLGIVAIATSPSERPTPWLGACLIGAVAVSLLWRPNTVRIGVSRRTARVVCILGFVVLAAAGVLLRHEIAVRAFAPSDGDRSVEWSAAFDQFRGSALIGVGPDRLLQFQATDGTYAHFAHNEYLQIAADSGLVGIALLGLCAVSVVRIVRRVDVLTSCAVAALICWAVAGAFDFDWHLPFVGLLGGWIVGIGAGARFLEATHK